MKYNRITRRQFLQGAGGFALALPFLPSLLPRALQAATIDPGKRFVGYRHPNGIYHPLYWPTDPTTVYASDVRYTALSSIPGDLSTNITNSLFGTVKSKINMVRGLDLVQLYGHNSTAMLGGYISVEEDGEIPNGITFDNVLKNSAKVYPNTPAFRSINMTPGMSEGISFDKSGNGFSRVPTYDDPLQAFNQIFASFIKTPATVDSNGAKKKVVDIVFQDYSSLRNSGKLSTFDVNQLESHMSRLSELQSKLAGIISPVTGSCTVPGKPQGFDTSSSWPEILAAMPELTKAATDIMVAALACGLTKVGTLVVKHNPYYDDNYSHDPVSHNGDQDGNATLKAAATKIYGWHAANVAYLIKQMDGIVESNGKTLLDNSLVYWGGEMGNGYIHNHDGMPVLLAGSLQGYFKTGYYVDYRRRPLVHPFDRQDWDSHGRVYNQLLVSILQGMGLSPVDYELANVAGFGNYNCRPPEYGIDYNTVYAPYLDTATRRAPLPFLVGT